MRLKILCIAIVGCGLGLAIPADAGDDVLTICPRGRTANLRAGVYTLRLDNGKSLDAEHWGRFEDGAALQGWDFHGRPNQLWLITPAGAGRYLVRSAAIAKAVDADASCRRAPGCRVFTWRTNRGASQIWRIERVLEMYRLRLADGGMQLGLAGDINTNGARAQTGTEGCEANQLWHLSRVGDYREISRAEGSGQISISVRLNNYTPRKHEFDRSGERAYFKPNDSYVAFWLRSRPYGSFPVSLPVIEAGPDRMFKTYVNDWSSNRTTATGESGRLKITVGFEDAGEEIITNCYNNFNCHVGEPRFDLRNTTMDVFIRPRFDPARGRFTFESETRFSTDISESGPCVNNFWAFVCDAFMPDRQSLVREQLLSTVNANLARGDVRTGLESLLGGLAGDPWLQNVTVGDDGELIFY